jgi:hypothetical protein
MRLSLSITNEAINVLNINNKNQNQRIMTYEEIKQSLPEEVLNTIREAVRKEFSESVDFEVQLRNIRSGRGAQFSRAEYELLSDAQKDELKKTEQETYKHHLIETGRLKTTQK